MSRINPTVAFLVAIVAVLAGLFLPGVLGGVVLLAVAAVAAAMLRGTWHRLSPTGRAARLVVLAILVFLAANRFLS